MVQSCCSHVQFKLLRNKSSQYIAELPVLLLSYDLQYNSSNSLQGISVETVSFFKLNLKEVTMDLPKIINSLGCFQKAQVVCGVSENVKDICGAIFPLSNYVFCDHMRET